MWYLERLAYIVLIVQRVTTRRLQRPYYDSTFKRVLFLYFPEGGLFHNLCERGLIAKVVS